MKNSGLWMAIFLWLLALAILLNGCVSTAKYSRELVVADMPRLNEIEQKSAALVKVVNFFGQALKPETLAKVKENLDLYYVHHEAASVALAVMRREDFTRHIDRARAELDVAGQAIRGELGI